MNARNLLQGRTFSKQFVLDLIRDNKILNEKILVNKEQEIFLHVVKINKKQWDEKYELTLYKWKKKILINSYKANYWYSVDEIFDYLYKNKLIEQKDPFSNLLGWLKEGINLIWFIDKEETEPKKSEDLKKENTKFEKNTFLKWVFSSTKKSSQIDDIKKMVVKDFKSEYNYNNLFVWEDGIISLYSDEGELLKSYEKEDAFLLAKEYLYLYLLNIPNKFSKTELDTLNKDIYIGFLRQKKLKQLIVKIISSSWENEKEIRTENPILKDFSVIYVLCSLQDLLIDGRGLRLWIEDLFSSNKIDNIESIQF